MFDDVTVQSVLGFVVFLGVVYGIYRLAMKHKEGRSSGTGSGGGAAKFPKPPTKQK